MGVEALAANACMWAPNGELDEAPVTVAKLREASCSLPRNSAVPPKRKFERRLDLR